MKHLHKLCLWRDANRRLLVIQQAACHFPLYHTTAWVQRVEQRMEQLPKFAISSDLRYQVMGSRPVDPKQEIHLPLKRLLKRLISSRITWLFVIEAGYLPSGLKHRLFHRLYHIGLSS